MAWRLSITTAALDQASYREKLAMIMDEANDMHLSEREAAQKFGEVMAALITLQRRVREWVDERQREKDHNKVTSRDHWHFSSYQKPDRQAARRRGWRGSIGAPRPAGARERIHTAG